MLLAALVVDRPAPPRSSSTRAELHSSIDSRCCTRRRSRMLERGSLR
jgi:hypothetical protein